MTSGERKRENQIWAKPSKKQKLESMTYIFQEFSKCRNMIRNFNAAHEILDKV